MPAIWKVVSSVGANREVRRVSGCAGATIDPSWAMVVGLGRFATLIASLSVPVFTGHLSVPHANAAEPDTSKAMAPKIARPIVTPSVIQVNTTLVAKCTAKYPG